MTAPANKQETSGMITRGRVRASSSVRAIVLIVLLAGVLGAGSARAQETMQVAQNAPGFQPAMVYQDFGKGESVNLANGGLTVTHPLAIALPQNLGGTLRPTRVYASKDPVLAWAPLPLPGDSPMGPFGMGWSLGYGRVYLHVTVVKTGINTSVNESQYYYEDESGAEHRLYQDSTIEPYAGSSEQPNLTKWYFTNDSSYIRGKFSDSTPDYPFYHWTLYFPDGSTRVAGGTNAFVAHTPGAQTAGLYGDVKNPYTNGWYVTALSDRAQNTVTISYYPQDTVHPYAGSINTITDNFSRTITFNYGTSGSYGATGVVWSVTGAGVTEKFTYASTAFPQYGSTPFPAITRAEDPAGLETVYGYGQYLEGPTAPWTLLDVIKYPTGAVSRYTYAMYGYTFCRYPANPNQFDCTIPQSGNSLAVSEHSVEVTALDPSGYPSGPYPAANRWVWTYDRSMSIDQPPPRGKAILVIVKDPLGTQEVHYFSANDGGGTEVSAGKEFKVIRRKPGAGPFSISTPSDQRIFQTTYGYDSGDRTDWAGTVIAGDSHRCKQYNSMFAIEKVPNGNRRVWKVVEEEFDPANQTTPVWSRTRRSSGWDGFGHYALTTEGADDTFVRATGSAYDLKKDRPAAPPYLYQLDRKTWAYSGAGSPPLLAPAPAPAPDLWDDPPPPTVTGYSLTGDFAVVSNTYTVQGLLETQTSYKALRTGMDLTYATLNLNPQPVYAAGDKRTQFTYAAGGNIAAVTYSGGDGGGSYGVSVTWAYGMASSVQWAGIAYPELTRAIDPVTSRIASQTGASGLTTSYTYDDDGRITKIAPPGGEYATHIEYPVNTIRGWTTGNRIRHYKGYPLPGTGVPGLTPGGAATGLSSDGLYTDYLFDDLGRLWRTDTVMHDGSWSEKVTLYDPLGRAVFASEPYAFAGSKVVQSYTVPNLNSGVLGAGAFSLSVPLSSAGLPFGTWDTVYAPSNPADPSPGLTAPFTGTLDPFYRTCRVIRPDNAAVTTSYNGLSATVTLKEINAAPGTNGGLTSATIYVKDVLGRLLSAQPAEGAAAAYVYDGLGRMIKATLSAAGPLTQTRTFTYDALGHLTQAINPENGITNYLAYDAIGNLLEYKDANGAAGGYKLVSAYDYKGRLLTASKTDGVVLQSLIENTYDTLGGVAQGESLGKLVKALSRQLRTDGTPVSTAQGFFYNGLGGRVSLATLATDASGAMQTFPLEIYYDPNGQTIKQAPPSVRPLQSAFSHGAVAARSMENQPVIPSFTYNAAGALTGLTFANGFIQQAALDDFNRPLGFRFQGNGAATLWANGSYAYAGHPYQYDGAGNITSIGAPGNRVDTFAYDLLSRLATASVNGGGYTHNYAYQYDAFGNLTSRVVSAPGAASLLAALSDSAKYASAALVPDGVAITSYIKNVVFQASLALDPVTGVTNNRLVSVSRGGTIQGVATGVLPQTASMVYDANGNLVDDGQFVYAYDPLNRQTAVWTRDATKPPNYKGALLSQAFYDAAGERAAGVTYDAAGIAKDFTAYLRDGAAVLWERTVTRDNAYPRKDKSYLYAAGRMAYARTRALSAFTGRSYIQMVGGAGGARLGAPVFSFDDDGQEAKAFYAVSGLTPDVAAFEIAVRALNPPPGQHDDETTQRFAKPAEGWPGGFQVLFKGLIPGISYGVTFTVETTLGTVPILGPRRVVLENGSFTAPLAPSAPCAWASRHWELNRGGAEDAEEELAVGWDHLENGGQGSYIVSMRVNGNETVLTPGPVSGNLVTMPVRTLPLPPGAAAGILAVTPLAGGGVALTAVPGGITPNVPYPPSTVTIHEYYATDHLGTVRAVYAIRPESPPQLQTFDYEPFGVELPSGASNTCDNTHRFTGHERDIATTGNDYMHFRYYGSNMGRFMKPDNISGNMGNPQSWNLYSYVVGNPVNFNDPTGHMVGIAWRSYYSAGGPGPCAGGGNHWFANEWGGGIGLGEHPWDSNPSGGSYSNFNITPVPTPSIVPHLSLAEPNFAASVGAAAKQTTMTSMPTWEIPSYLTRFSVIPAEVITASRVVGTIRSRISVPSQSWGLSLLPGKGANGKPTAVDVTGGKGGYYIDADQSIFSVTGDPRPHQGLWLAIEPAFMSGAPRAIYNAQPNVIYPVPVPRPLIPGSIFIGPYLGQ